MQSSAKDCKSFLFILGVDITQFYEYSDNAVDPIMETGRFLPPISVVSFYILSFVCNIN